MNWKVIAVKIFYGIMISLLVWFIYSSICTLMFNFFYMVGLIKHAEITVLKEYIPIIYIIAILVWLGLRVMRTEYNSISRL
ncbi:hypothetical protein [Methanocaldococcus sp.]